MASTARTAIGKRQGEVLETEPWLEEKIRERAHELWLQRGGGEGSDVEDWLQAEQETLWAE